MHFPEIFQHGVIIEANYAVTSQKFAKLLDVCSLTCKIKVLNGHVLEI